MNRRSFFRLVAGAVVAASLPKLAPRPVPPGLASLARALEAGSFIQGQALHVEDLSAVMEVVTFSSSFVDLRRPDKNIIFDGI